MATTPQPVLLRLPREVCDKIYKELFSNVNIIKEHGAIAHFTNNFKPEVFLTCHKIRQEALPTLFSTLTLLVRPCACGTDSIPAYYMGKIRTAVMLQSRHSKNFYRALRCRLPSLRLLQISIPMLCFEDDGSAMNDAQVLLSRRRGCKAHPKA